MAQKVDIVVVAYTGELRALKLQARSIRLYLDPTVAGSIHVIVHDNNLKKFRQYFDEEIAAEYGHFANKVRLVEYSKVTGRKLTTPDWTSQQAVKMLAAKLVTNATYLILDTKNHFIRPLTAQSMFSEDARLRMPLGHFHVPYQPYFEAALSYFNAQVALPLPAALPTITPFLANTQIVCDMVVEMEIREKRPFIQIFTDGKRYREFYLYLAYILARKGGLEPYYENRPNNCMTFFSHQETPSAASWKQQQIACDHVYCLGVHRRAIGAKDPEFAALISSYWQQYGLIKNLTEAAYFLTNEKSSTASLLDTAAAKISSVFTYKKPSRSSTRIP